MQKQIKFTLKLSTSQYREITVMINLNYIFTCVILMLRGKISNCQTKDHFLKNNLKIQIVTELAIFLHIMDLKLGGIRKLR